MTDLPPLESSVDVVLWAISRTRPITITDIRARWGVHKSTAWRWRDLLNEARERSQGLRPQYRTPATTTTEARAP